MDQPIQQPSQNEPYQAQQPPKNPLGGNKRLYVVALVIVAVSVVLAVGGIFLLRAGVSSVSNQVTHTPAPTPQAISNEQSATDTSTWQTYRNEEFGFELKYPADTITSYAWGGNSNTPILGVPVSGEGPLIYFRVLLRDRGDTVPQDSLLGRSDEAWEKVGPVEKEIDGEIVYVNEFRGKQWNWLEQEYYFSDFVLLFSYDHIGYTGIGNQILSTFRFIY